MSGFSVLGSNRNSKIQKALIPLETEFFVAENGHIRRLAEELCLLVIDAPTAS